jgi:15-cis-phytoene synthase
MTDGVLVLKTGTLNDCQMKKNFSLGAQTLDKAYAVCESTTKRRAKNFYYGFLVLPVQQRKAICAIYAFMRYADDVADDENLSKEDRRQRLENWLAAWWGASGGGATTDPVLLAVRDAVDRYAIPTRLLDELIDGVATDLRPRKSGGPATCATFADLYMYCYQVASVVGLVCIRIFGYQNPAAEKLAEETGVAFQLTNILRDVAEDAGRDRIYLPLELLRTYGVSLESLIDRRPGSPPTANERMLLAEIGRRAEGYYKSAERLLPLIDQESRPAMWVLISIYRSLLRRIQRTNYDVFSRRISVPVAKKLGILAVGVAKARLFVGEN